MQAIIGANAPSPGRADSPHIFMLTNPPQYKRQAQNSFLVRFAPSFILLLAYAILFDRTHFIEALYYLVHGSDAGH
jgi:hypothetical protein